MTLTEILKANGLTEDQIKSITETMKENKIFTASEENMDVRYNKLKTDHDALTAKDAESQKLIADLQKSAKDNESIQTKITEYEATIQKQVEELQNVQTESALKIGLLAAGAKATDIDYLIFKMKADDTFKVALDDNGQIKGLDEKVKSMKTQFPSQFDSASQKKIEEKKLEKPDDNSSISQDDFKKMGYQQRVQLFNENPNLYEELAK